MEIAGADEYQYENTVLYRYETILFIGICDGTEMFTHIRIVPVARLGWLRNCWPKAAPAATPEVSTLESGTRAVASVAAIHYADGSVWMAD